MGFPPRRTVAAFLEAAALLAVLALAAYLRLANAADNPGWYTDEGTHLDIAQHLAQGRVQYLAVTQSTLLFAKLPLFEGALAALLRVFGGGMATLRTFTGVLGVASVALLYAVSRWALGGERALLPALMLAIYPQAVLYSRFGFSYNLLAPLVLLALWGMWMYLDSGRRRGLALAAIAVGLGATSDLAALTFVAPLALIVLARRPRDLLWSLPLVVNPFAVYAAAMLLTAPAAFRFDLGFTLARMGGGSLATQVSTLALNYTTLLAQDFWFLAGMVGLFLLRPARLRWSSLLMLLVPLALMGRSAALYSLTAYYMIPLLPLVALGAAVFAHEGARRVRRLTHESAAALLRRWGRSSRAAAVGATLVALGIVATPLLTTAALCLDHVPRGFPTAIYSFLVNPQDARRGGGFVNASARSGDVVIASPAVAWLVEADAADFQMAVAAAGQATPHLPADLPPDRWAFDPRIEWARYVIVDNLWRNWGEVHVPGLAEITREIETSWLLVFESGAIAVYRRPGS